MSSEEAQLFLNSLINKTLRVHASDSRIFVGSLKCTDRDRNIILSLTHEYRHPSTSAVESAAAAAETNKTNKNTSATGNVKVDMLKRFVGLVVVPGEYITKIEVED